MPNKTNAVVITIHVNPVDKEQMELLTRHIQAELIDKELITLSSENEISPSSAKDVDPVFAAVGLSVLSSSVPQLLTFLHDWVLRRENQTLKIKIQARKNQVVEMEIPSSMSKRELAELIELVQNTAKDQKNKG